MNFENLSKKINNTPLLDPSKDNKIFREQDCLQERTALVNNNLIFCW